jgi:putative FmdB family regulatory protein
MPTYDYVCDACEHAFEQWQSFKDDALTKCPKCKKNMLRRLIGGGAAIVFKGSGFYETDYNRSESYRKQAQADAEGPAKAESETKSESKPEAKAETPAPAAESKPAKAAKPKKDAK